MIDWLDRVGRPLTRLAVLTLVLVVTWVFFALGVAMVQGFERWARGDGVDLHGLGTAMGGGAAILGVLMPFIVSLFRDRRIERVEQIRAGVPSQAPFGPSGPPTGVPRVEAGSIEDLNGPRPWQNHQ